MSKKSLWLKLFYPNRYVKKVHEYLPAKLVIRTFQNGSSVKLIDAPRAFRNTKTTKVFINKNMDFGM